METGNQSCFYSGSRSLSPYAHGIIRTCCCRDAGEIRVNYTSMFPDSIKNLIGRRHELINSELDMASARSYDFVVGGSAKIEERHAGR